ACALPIFFGEAGGTFGQGDHGVEGIGNDNDERIGGVLRDILGDFTHDLAVDAQQIVAAHPRLARHTGGDNADIGALDVRVAFGAARKSVVPFDRFRFE